MPCLGRKNRRIVYPTSSSQLFIIRLRQQRFIPQQHYALAISQQSCLTFDSKQRIYPCCCWQFNNKKCNYPGSNRGPLACEANVITNYTIVASCCFRPTSQYITNKPLFTSNRSLSYNNTYLFTSNKIQQIKPNLSAPSIVFVFWHWGAVVACNAAIKNIKYMNHSGYLESNISQFIIRYSGDALQTSKKAAAKLISASSNLDSKHYKKKVKRVDCSEVASVEKISRKQQAQSVHTNADERKEEKEYSRVPIQYIEQRDQGNPADRVRGRVVYRGYAPKNTYFYFKTIKELNIVSSDNARQERDYRGEDVVFNSKFQSGNLNSVVRVNSREYWLYMREDTNTHGLRQWFFFEMKARKSCKLRLRIYKFSKKISLYKLGMKPFVRTKEDNWRQDGEKVKYEYDSEQKCFYLEFQYQFEEHKETYFATLPPYTYSTLTTYLEGLSYEEKVSVRRVGTSLSGLDIMAVNIIARKHHKNAETERQRQKHDPSKTYQKSFHSHSQKEAIIVLSRTHPGETVSNFALEAFISKVLETPLLTEHFNFYIIPMVNPDGVFLGNHRTGVLGQDLNRNFHASDLQFFPEIETVQNYIINVQKKHKVAFLFDLHGHSAKKNIFAYGEQADSGTSKYLFGRIIPKILSNLIESFRYDHCVFRAAKEKKHTARVYFSHKNGINSVTFQQSYGLLQTGNIGIANWRNFGTALADSLVHYLSFERENIIHIMTNYLQDQMDKERLHQERKEQLKRERQRAKTRIATKTEINEEQAAKVTVQDMIKKLKGEKSEKSQEVVDIVEEAEEVNQSNSEEQQGLSSGDEDLQLQDHQLEALKKEIVRVGIQNRQSCKRQLYNMAEKKVELGQHYVAYSQRLHHKQTSMAQRIFKFRSRQKIRETQGFVQAMSYRQKGESIELPYIRK